MLLSAVTLHPVYCTIQYFNTLCVYQCWLARTGRSNPLHSSCAAEDGRKEESTTDTTTRMRLPPQLQHLDSWELGTDAVRLGPVACSRFTGCVPYQTRRYSMWLHQDPVKLLDFLLRAVFSRSAVSHVRNAKLQPRARDDGMEWRFSSLFYSPPSCRNSLLLS